MSKKLVAYFSASGVTKSVAERIAKVANADLFEIKPTMPYTNADLDWRDKTSRSSVEMSNPDSRPKIANKLDNMADYDIVLIGFPIWWYVAPTIIDTFVESYDLSGKTIVPFATSGGSGMGKTVDVLSKLSPNAKWQTGKMANGISEKEIENWVNNLYYRKRKALSCFPFSMYYILKIVLTIPLRHLGILTTTIFIFTYSFLPFKQTQIPKKQKKNHFDYRNNSHRKKCSRYHTRTK